MNWDAATTGLLAAVVFVACFFAVYIPLRRALLRKAIYDCFAKYAPVEGDKHTLDAIAIDMDGGFADFSRSNIARTVTTINVELPSRVKVDTSIVTITNAYAVTGTADISFSKG
jgi:hypothetical protein